MEIDNNDEERRVEQRRAQEKLAVEQRQKKEVQRSFEAKLSEKTAQEKESLESQIRTANELQEEIKERQSLLDKILGVAGKEQADQAGNSKIQHKKYLEEQEGKEQKFDLEQKEHAKVEMKERKSEKANVENEKKKGEEVGEGHRRIEERAHSDQGGRGEGNFSGSQNQGGGSHGRDSGSDSGSESRSRGQELQKMTVKDLENRYRLHPIKKGVPLSAQFLPNPRAFKSENLNEMVSRIQTGLTRSGEDFFAVELSDDYFDGLKVQATRTADGVVLKFMCPNASVRSTFVKHRLAVYAALQAKNVSVFRIDVI